MATWQVGDKAVCVVFGPLHCGGNCKHNGTASTKSKAPLSVVKIGPSLDLHDNPSRCGCIALYLEDGTAGVADRFRKVVPDKHEPAADAEFLTLMGGVKAKTRQLAKV